MVKRYTASELEDLPVLCTGQADDLHVEGEDAEGPYRIWLSRCGVEDGEPYDNKITVERYDGRRWYDHETYPG